MKKLTTFLCFATLHFFAAAQELPPPDLEQEYRLGTEALQNFRFQEALRHFFECQRNEPDNVEYLSKTGYCYFQLGNLTESRIYFSQVLKKDSAHVSSLNYLANIEEQLFDHKSAFARYLYLIGIDSTNGYYHRSAGGLAEKMGDGLAAVYLYAKALQLNPNDNAALISLCNLYAQSDQLAVADSLLNSALRKQPEHLRLLYSLAEIKYRQKQFGEVVPLMEKAFSLGDTSLVYLPLLPFSLAQTDHCEAAITWFNYFLERRDANEQTHYFLGFCYQKTGELDKSLEHYKLAILSGISTNIAVYYERSGDVKSEKKQFKEALIDYQKALDYGSGAADIYFNMAVAYDHLNKKKKSKPLEYYRKYLAHKEAKNGTFRLYATERIGEIEQYEKEAWKGE